MRGIRNCMLGVLTIVGLGFCSVMGAEAAEKNEETGMSFTYANKVPDNQLKEGNFFDLMMAKGQEQVLETELTNLTDQDLIINVSINNATTSEAGVIDYGPSEQRNTENLSYGLKDILKVPASVTLPKNGKTTLKLSLKMPTESIQGVILGGVQLEQEVDERETLKESVSINNQYAYVYSVSIRETEEVPAFAFESGDTTVDVKGEPIASLNFSNQAPRIIKDMTVETLVTPKDSEKVLGEQRLEKAKMAPNSVISIPLDVALDSGEYQTKTTVKVGDESWQWVEDFTVEAEKSDKPAAEISQDEPKRNNSGLIIVSILSLLIIGTGVLYFVIVKR